MKPTDNRLIVRVNMEQKEVMKIGGIEVRTANLFKNNHREKSPVLAEVIEGNELIRKGEVLICHHNHFFAPSPYFLQDDLYSIPYNSTIFASLDAEGNIKPVCENILCDRVTIPTPIPVPKEQEEKYIDRVIVVDGGRYFHKGTLLFIRKHAYYEIVYFINGVEHRIHKVKMEFVIGKAVSAN